MKLLTCIYDIVTGNGLSESIKMVAKDNAKNDNAKKPYFLMRRRQYERSLWFSHGSDQRCEHFIKAKYSILIGQRMRCPIKHINTAGYLDNGILNYLN